MDAQPKIIFRVEKIKQATLRLALNHGYRISKPKNADPDRAKLNYYNAPARQAINETESRLRAAMRLQERETGRKMRKDAVVVADVFLGASPEFFDVNYKAQSRWVNRALKWLGETYGEENILGFALHMDEKTPHLHAYVMPRIGNRFQYNKIHTRKTLSEMQTSIAERMESLGLVRGRRGSVAKHETVKKYYGRLDELKDENEQLRAENKTLKKRLNYLKQQLQPKLQPKMTTHYKPQNANI